MIESRSYKFESVPEVYRRKSICGRRLRPDVLVCSLVEVAEVIINKMVDAQQDYEHPVWSRAQI
jgi:hypothetical protein